MGLYATAVARDHGASRVFVIGAPAHRLEVARAFGADEVLNIEEYPDPAARKEWVLEHTSGRGPDVVIQVATSNTAVLEGLDFIRPGGRYVNIGGVGSATVPASYLGFKYLTVIGIANTLGRHFHQALQFLATKQNLFPFERILSATYPLEQTTEAIQAMADYSIVKPVILPSGE